MGRTIDKMISICSHFSTTLLDSISYHDIIIRILQSNNVDQSGFYEFIIKYRPDCTQQPLSHECMGTK